MRFKEGQGAEFDRTVELFQPLSGSGSVRITGAGALNLATTTDYAGGLDISTDATHIEGGYAQRFSIAPEFTLDLCGNDQKFGVLNSTGGTITSDEPAILHLIAKYEYHDYGDQGCSSGSSLKGGRGGKGAWKTVSKCLIGKFRDCFSVAGEGVNMV